MRSFLLLLALFACLALPLQAQKKAEPNRFSVGLKAGATASQINGDNMAGYDKLGFTGGLKVLTRLSPKTSLGLEILYSQRGSQTKRSNTNGINNKINLQFIEIPVYLTLKDWLAEDNYYKMHLQAGLSYGRLFNAEVEYYYLAVDPSNLKKTDISWMLGATFFATRHIGFSARYTRAFTHLLTNSLNKRDSWRSHFLSFDVTYMF